MLWKSIWLNMLIIKFLNLKHNSRAETYFQFNLPQTAAIVYLKTFLAYEKETFPQVFSGRRSNLHCCERFFHAPFCKYPDGQYFSQLRGYSGQGFGVNSVERW